MLPDFCLYLMSVRCLAVPRTGQSSARLGRREQSSLLALASRVGLDPPNYTRMVLEATGGIEPPNTGFADPCLTTWLRGHVCWKAAVLYHAPAGKSSR